MNIRSLTRGDGAVIGAALLLLVVSFISFYGAEGDCRSVPGLKIDCDFSAWNSGLLPLVTSLHLAGLIAAGLIVGSRFLPEGRKLVGLSLDQWGTALAVFAFWTALWSMLGGGDGSELRIGAFLSFLFAAALAGAAVARTLVPALAAPLLPAPKPAGLGGPQGPHGMPGPHGHQPGGYGYPTPGQPGQPGGQPGQHGQPGQPGGYGYPGGGAPSFGGGAPGSAPAPAPAPAPGPHGGPGGGAHDFTPFWFAVPAQRPIFPEDGSSGAPIAELTPGVWYLAVDQRGQAIVAQTQDGRRGVLQDTSGIQRG